MLLHFLGLLRLFLLLDILRVPWKELGKTVQIDVRIKLKIKIP
jgi:hypothetical protein